MNTKTTLLLAAALLASPALKAQQNPQPTQPQPAPEAQTDCTPTTPQPPSELGKHVHFHLPSSVRKVWDENRQKISNRTGIDIGPPPSPTDIVKQPQKPCTPAPPPTPSTLKPPANQVSPTPPGSTVQQPPRQAAPAPSNGAATVSPKQSDFYADELACLLKRQRDNDPSDPSTCIPSPPTTTTAPKQ